MFQSKSDPSKKFGSVYVQRRFDREHGIDPDTIEMNQETKPQPIPGMVQQGNIDLNNRPIVNNPDGTHSSELSFSRGTDQGEVLVPRVVNGKMLSQDDAWKHYQKTGEHMGVFETPEDADAYATQVHGRELPSPNQSHGTPMYVLPMNQSKQ